MPYFFTESSPYAATWFYIISRLLQAFGLLWVFTVKHKQVGNLSRWLSYSIAVIFSLIFIVIVYHPSQLLPPLIFEVGISDLKIALQIIALIVQLLFIIHLSFRKASGNRKRDMLLVLGSIYLIFSDYMFITYKDVFDVRNFMGHVFSLGGFYFFINALYYSSVEKPFKDLIQTKNELLSSVRTLEETTQKLEKSESNLHHLAFHDELTQLPNARSFSEKINEQLTKDDNSFSVLMIEVDRLSSLKTSLGIEFSNLLIQQVSTRLNKFVSNDVFLARLRSGEFIIIYNEQDNKKVSSFAEKIRETMTDSFQLQHLMWNGSLNIGISRYPFDGGTEEELLKQAQIAMQEAFDIKKGYMYYDSNMGNHLLKNIVLEQDLHYALERQQLYLEYQPIVSTYTGKIESLEALIRWNHPSKGKIPPFDFIHIAEESGLIIPIGKWILQEACKDVIRFQANGMDDVSVAVNLSIRQFYQQNLIEVIDDILKSVQLNPKYLELEVTESMTMNTNHALNVLTNLKELGVSIAVDDFGTGYSSLSYLKDFPIDCLKIDRSFICNINNDDKAEALIPMIISMAKHLNLEVVAEGVEDANQMRYLNNRKCDYIQGYLISKPLSADELIENFLVIEENAKKYC